MTVRERERSDENRRDLREENLTLKARHILRMDEENKKQTMKMEVRFTRAKGRPIRYDMNKSRLEERETPKTGEDGQGRKRRSLMTKPKIYVVLMI